TVTVTDNGSGALSDTETYTLEVHETNDAPVLTYIGDQATDEDNSLTGLSVIFTDLETFDSHTITVVSDEANVSVLNLSGHISGSTYDLVPAADWNGIAQITVTVTDDGPGTLFDSETYTITVNPGNDAPVITAMGDQSTDEDNALGLSVIFTDLEAFDAHTIAVVSGEPNVTVENLSGHISGSTYDLVPAADWNGTAQITVTVTDNGAGALFDSETYTLTVNAVNDAPSSITLSNSTIDEKVELGTVIGLFTSNDVEFDDTHQYELIPIGGTVDLDNESFIIVGDTLKTNEEIDYEIQSSYSIYVQSDDGNGGTTSQAFIVTINDVDETSVEDINNPLSFNVYPVPAVDKLTVEIDNPENCELLLEIYTNTGALVHSELTFIGNTIDLAEFKDGMYFLSIRGENVYGTRKIIVKD
ncbi:MAG: T9SS type A sorting domain-containing protein, partial [Bacteroidales bacterium]|nr:T9SS type A sorting domain-containing protein [Bacteroidales bacterium]